MPRAKSKNPMRMRPKYHAGSSCVVGSNGCVEVVSGVGGQGILHGRWRTRTTATKSIVPAALTAIKSVQYSGRVWSLLKRFFDHMEWSRQCSWRMANADGMCNGSESLSRLEKIYYDAHHQNCHSKFILHSKQQIPLQLTIRRQTNLKVGEATARAQNVYTPVTVVGVRGRVH